MTSPFWFKPLYILSGIWQEAGWGAVVYMAALAGVDQQLYEAAKVDGASVFQRILHFKAVLLKLICGSGGAGRLKRIWHVTLPGIAPTMITMLILNCGKVMNVGYEKVYLMQNALNISSSDVISTYVYTTGILKSQFSFSTAVNLFNSVINTILILVVNKISRKVSETSLW